MTLDLFEESLKFLANERPFFAIGLLTKIAKWRHGNDWRRCHAVEALVAMGELELAHDVLLEVCRSLDDSYARHYAFELREKVRSALLAATGEQ